MRFSMQNISLLQITQLPSPCRNLCYNSLLNMLGAAIMTTGWTVYATRFLKLDTLWLTIIGSMMALGLLIGSIAAGKIVDHIEPRTSIILSNIIFGLSMIALAFSHSPMLIAIWLALSGFASSFNAPAKSVFFTQYATQTITHTRSITASYSYLGTALGTVGGIITLALNQPQVFAGTIIINGVSNLIVALLALRLPRIHATERSEGKKPRSVHANKFGAFADRRFIFCCIMLDLPVIAIYAINTAMPIWLVRFTTLPTVLVGVYQALQMMVGMLLHTVLTRNSTSFAAGLRDFIKFALIGSFACLLLPISLICTQQLGYVAGIVAFCCAALLASVSIIGANGAIWAVSYALRKDGHQGDYESASNFIDGICGVAMPYITTPLCSTTPIIGWLIAAGLGMVFSLSSISLRHINPNQS